MATRNYLPEPKHRIAFTELQWRESGVYAAEYVKLGSEWKISNLKYHKA